MNIEDLWKKTKKNIEIKGRLNRHDFTDKDVEEQD